MINVRLHGKQLSRIALNILSNVVASVQDRDLKTVLQTGNNTNDGEQILKFQIRQ